MRRKVRVCVEQNYSKQIVKDLGDTAYHLQNRIVAMDASEDDREIFPDIIAALTLTAFWFEACLNFIGDTEIHGWKERNSFDSKMKRVFKHCGIDDDTSARPFVTVKKLKNFRDTLAHGTPDKGARETIEVRDFGDMQLPDYHQSSWEQMCTVATVSECYADVEMIWRQLLSSIGKTEVDAYSQASRGLTYLGETES